MAKETQIGQLVIDLKIKTEALEKGLETAKKKLQQIENENKNVQNSNKEMENSWLALGVTAGLTFAKVVNAIKSATDEYKAHTQAMEALSNVASYTENDMSDFTEIMNKYSTVMTQTDLADTIKNFSLMGFTVEQTDQMIQALTNSAIRNRNANYTVSQAVKVASDGYKQGLSTLSDSAGVTENLSVMLDNYAKNIGKTASQLTEAEKNQAYLNRTMYAAEPFAGAMEGYMDSLAGKQGEYSQALRETQIAYAEALEPTLKDLTELKTNLLNVLTNLISKNNEATVGTTAFIVAMTASIAIVVAVKKVKDLYTKSVIKATIAENGFTAALAANPLGLYATAISLSVGVLAAYKTHVDETTEAQAKLNEVTDMYNKIQNGTLETTEENIIKMKDNQKAISDQLTMYILISNTQKQIEDLKSKGTETIALPHGVVEMDKEGAKIAALEENLKIYRSELEKLKKANGNFGDSFDEVHKKLLQTNEYINEATVAQKINKALDIESTKTKQKEAAQLKANANQMQIYLDTVKQGNKNTTEYQNAVKKLTKAYPEAANAEGIIIDQAQDFINAEQLKADQAWNSSQEVINSYIEMLTAAQNSAIIQQQVAEYVGDSWENIAPRLQSVLSILQTMAGYTPESTPNITPLTTTKSSSSSSYSNKRLDNYKKEIEHKKALDKISIQEEIKMYEYALRNYAKTSDEKMELREKIYDLNKELANKEKELLEKQTEDYENYIQDVKNARGAAYDITEQTADYNKIIQLHKSYLSQIMKDERLSLDERKELYREELNTIRDYEQKKRDLRVEQIDNTVTQLTNAITKQLEEMQAKDKEAIDKNLEEVEKWKEARINAINAEYDARIEAIEKELEALDKAEQQKSRDEEDAEYEKKKKRLEELIAFEHDATTKANYQKELDKLVAEYQKTLNSRTLEDKKEALNAQKDLLKEEQNNNINKVEETADKQKKVYEQQLNELEKYYDEQQNMAQDTAEKMLLNTEQNQDKILSLLKSYGDAYEITGQTLGEKLAQGINEGLVNKIENIIQKIQDTIDNGIRNKLSELASSSYKYEEGVNKPKTQTINVYQTNNIEQNPEMPSETYRKLRNIDEQLASSLAGM